MICQNHVDVDEGVSACTRCGGNFCGDCVVLIHGQPYCATCKSEKLLDVQSGTDRPQLPLATIGRRFAALMIDRLLFAAAGAAFLPAPYARGNESVTHSALKRTSLVNASAFNASPSVRIATVRRFVDA